MHTLPLCSVGDRLATGYESDGSEEPLYDIGWWGPASQMYSSASDLNKVGRSSMAAARSRVAPWQGCQTLDFVFDYPNVSAFTALNLLWFLSRPYQYFAPGLDIC